MAIQKKTGGKRFKKQMRKIVQGDLFTSVAVVSILLNILFLITVVVLTSSSTFDRRFYTAARTRYCSNLSSVDARAEELGDTKKAIQEWQVTCVGKDFKPFYNEALDKYQAQLNQ